MKRAVFIDKDGTLVEDVPYNVDPALVRFTPSALQGLKLLRDHGFELVIVTNQPGLAMGRFDRKALARLQQHIAACMASAGAPLAGFYACPHAPASDGTPACNCRKPAPGLLERAADELGIDLARSWMIGDILNDVEAGRRAGCSTVFMDVGNETEWQLGPMRTPSHCADTLLEAAQCILDDAAVAAAAVRSAVRPHVGATGG